MIRAGAEHGARREAVPAWRGPRAEWFMDYRNADGSVAEMCGNGVRVFAAFAERLGVGTAGGLARRGRAPARPADRTGRRPAVWFASTWARGGCRAVPRPAAAGHDAEVDVPGSAIAARR